MKLTPEQVRVCRINLGLTQGELAKKVGITSGMIGHIERGERIMASDIENKVRQAFGLSNKEIGEIMAVHERVNRKKLAE